MIINAKDLKTIKSDLAQRRQARLAAADDRDLSTRETILRLAPELRKMKRHGFTTAELLEVLKGHGFNIKGASLNRYLAESQPHKTTATKRQSRNQEDVSPIEEKVDTKSPTDFPTKDVGTMR